MLPSSLYPRELSKESRSSATLRQISYTKRTLGAKRTGRWRNEVRQQKDAEEATRRSEQAASAGERNTRKGTGNKRSTEAAQGLTAVEQEKNRMREKLRLDEK